MTRQRSLSPFLFQIVGPLSRAAGAGFLISSAMRQYQRPEFRLGYVHPHTVQEDPQRGPQWLHELKHDGIAWSPAVSVIRYACLCAALRLDRSLPSHCRCPG
jgi:hypothetical protein